MGISVRQANFVIPEDILEDLRKHVARRQQSRFVAEALRKELKKLRLESALENSFGAWGDNDHPDLAEGTEEFVRKIRKSTRLSEER